MELLAATILRSLVAGQPSLGVVVMALLVHLHPTNLHIFAVHSAAVPP